MIFVILAIICIALIAIIGPFPLILLSIFFIFSKIGKAKPGKVTKRHYWPWEFNMKL